MMFWLLFLHIVGASIWVGGHLYLITIIVPQALRHQDSTHLLKFEAGFERLGMTALVLQVVTGLIMAKLYLGTWAELLNHKNQLAALISMKLLWLGLSIVTALSAQLIVIPKVKKNPSDARLRRLFILHIMLIGLLSLIFVATGVLFRVGM